MWRKALTTERLVTRSFIGRDLTFLESTYIYFISPEGWFRARECCGALLKESSATLSRACTLYRAPPPGGGDINPRVNRLLAVDTPSRISRMPPRYFPSNRFDSL